MPGEVGLGDGCLNIREFKVWSSENTRRPDPAWPSSRVPGFDPAWPSSRVPGAPYHCQIILVQHIERKSLGLLIHVVREYVSEGYTVVPSSSSFGVLEMRRIGLLFSPHFLVPLFWHLLVEVEDSHIASSESSRLVLSCLRVWIVVEPQILQTTGCALSHSLAGFDVRRIMILVLPRNGTLMLCNFQASCFATLAQDLRDLVRFLSRQDVMEVGSWVELCRRCRVMMVASPSMVGTSSLVGDSGQCTIPLDTQFSEISQGYQELEEEEKARFCLLIAGIVDDAVKDSSCFSNGHPRLRDDCSSVRTVMPLGELVQYLA
ncbi:hypothetical protein Tco_0567283 [Tanacetum coccineum]